MSNYKRRIYLINPKFQFKYALFVCIFVVLVTIIYPWTIYDIFNSIKQFVHPDIDVDAQRNQLLLFLGLMEAVLVVIVAVFMIFITHKVAGPMYKLEQTFKAVKDGGPLKRVYFRNGDNFQEIAHGYNDLVEVVQARIDSSYSDLTEILANLKKIEESNPDLKETIIKLELLISDDPKYGISE